MESKKKTGTDAKVKSKVKPSTGEKPASKSGKKLPSLAYGFVKHNAFLFRGKWRFVSRKEDTKKHNLLSSRRLKALKEGKTLKPKRTGGPQLAKKPIKGEKNGEFRVVGVKRKAYYPSQKRPAKHRSRGLYREHKRNFRPSLVPGAILIILAGVNKGKRVVLLKCLPSGLLLVTGPFLLNAVPLRRVQPCHVIATKTRIDVGQVELPPEVKDKYFKRKTAVSKKKKAEKVKVLKKGKLTIFKPKKKVYRPDQSRKALQKAVDTQVLAAIKKSPEKKSLYAYLATMFGLRNNQYPHRMKF